MIVTRTAIRGVLILQPPRHADARGVFQETWSRAAMAAAGIDIDFVQDNRSVSHAAGTVRGLHAQAPPHAQAKLVRCGAGRLLDVAVDVRRGSPTRGAHVAVELDPEEGRQLLVPEGCLHGFVTRAPETEILYKCSAPYAPGSECAVRWDSAGIDWGVTDPVLSDRDRAAPPLGAFDSPFAAAEAET